MAVTALSSWDLPCAVPSLPRREALLASQQSIMRFLTTRTSHPRAFLELGFFQSWNLSSSLTVPGTSLHLGLNTRDLCFSLLFSSEHFVHKMQLALVDPQPRWGRWCHLGPTITAGPSPARFCAASLTITNLPPNKVNCSPVFQASHGLTLPHTYSYGSDHLPQLLQPHPVLATVQLG